MRVMTPLVLVRTVLIAGLLVGTLDGVAAVVNYLVAGGTDPAKVFRFIASGAFGRETAYAPGALMPVLGVGFHYFIATIWSAIYAVAARHVRALTARPIVAGALYGVFVWAMMSQVVVPLSRAPSIPFRVSGALVGIVIHIFCVGLPIALTVRRGRGSR
jgi:hypothetical protein